MHHEVSHPYMSAPEGTCPICEAEAKGLVKRERTIFLEIKSRNGIPERGRYLKLSESVYNAIAHVPRDQQRLP